MAAIDITKDRVEFIDSGVTRGWTAPGDTLQGVTPEGKKFVGKFT